MVSSTGVLAFLQLFINMEPQHSNEDSTSGPQEDLSVKMMFCDETVRGPTTLLKIPCSYLVLKWFKYCQHSDKNKSMYGLAFCFFKNVKNSGFAIQQLKSLPSVSAGRTARVRAGGPVPVYSFREQDNEQIIARNMSQRF